MNVYIVFLKGINVGGHNRLKMDALKNALKSIGFENCKTYIQSGNIVLQSTPNNSSIITNKVETLLKEEFELQISVLTISLEDLELVFNYNPYPESETKKRYYTFYTENLEIEKLQQLEKMNFDNDEFHIQNKTIYINCKNGYGKTKLSNNFFEKKLNTTCTTRNWNTLNKVLLLAQNF